MAVILFIVVVALAGFWLFFFVLKRVLRMALRLAVVGAVLLAVLLGALAWFWYAPSEKTPSQSRNAPRQTRPAR
jgi:hypothetical protein